MKILPSGSRIKRKLDELYQQPSHEVESACIEQRRQLLDIKLSQLDIMVSGFDGSFNSPSFEYIYMIELNLKKKKIKNGLLTLGADIHTIRIIKYIYIKLLFC